MSFGGRLAQTFFDPLQGKSATFLLESREDNLQFAKSIIGFLGTNDECVVLDLDALYASSADLIFSGASESIARSITIRVPDPSFVAEAELPNLFALRNGVVVIDSLNTLHHLLSPGDGSSRTRKLAFAVASLSYLARTNGKAVIFSMYAREGFGRSGTGHSIAELSEVTAAVDVRQGELNVRTIRGTAWPEGSFSSRIP